MAGVTVKLLPLLSTPAAVTTTLPVVAPAGTGTTIEVSPHVVTAAVVPLKVTLLPVTWVVPKFVPVMVIDWPIGPEGEDKPLITGGGTTAKVVGALLADPLGLVTTIGPVPVVPAPTVSVICVDEPGVMVAAVPLIVAVVTVSRPVPVIVTVAPIAPEVGLMPEMVVPFTVKGTALLSTLLVLVTTTFALPVVAFAGTLTVIEVSLQLRMSDRRAVVAPNFTEVDPFCAAPKFKPAMTIVSPLWPLFGVRELISGAAAPTGKPESI